MQPLLLGNHQPLNPMTTLSWSLDRRRKKQMSNKDWANVSDPDAEIMKNERGAHTHLAHKAEHAVDLD
jgi:hypothetical protein